MSIIPYIIGLSIGLLLGMAVLPWKHRMAPRDSLALYLLAWACLWPVFLAGGLWEGLQAYQRAWWAYSDRLRAARMSKHDVTEEAVLDFPAHHTLRETYFKRQNKQ